MKPISPSSPTLASWCGSTIPIRPSLCCLQRRLNQLGCWSKIDAKGKAVPLDVDGDFGQLTASAVKLFQARSLDSDGKPLSVDGAVGRTTWSALFGTAVVAPATSSGAPE